MDKDIMRLRAHVDQTRSNLRDRVRDIPADELAAMIKTCAMGDLARFDAREQLVVGLLAIVSIFDFIETPQDQIGGES